MAGARWRPRPHPSAGDPARASRPSSTGAMPGPRRCRPPAGRAGTPTAPTADGPVTADGTVAPFIVPARGARVAPPGSARLAGVDAARGVALLGMMAAHSLSADDANGNPTLSYSLTSGRSAAAFAVLAGVGIAFMTGRARVRPGRDGRAAAASLAARALAIGAIGLALGYTDTEFAEVILPYYAVLFALAIPLVFAPHRGPGGDRSRHRGRGPGGQPPAAQRPGRGRGSQSLLRVPPGRPARPTSRADRDRLIPGPGVDGLPVRRAGDRPAGAVHGPGGGRAARRRRRPRGHRLGRCPGWRWDPSAAAHRFRRAPPPAE